MFIQAGENLLRRPEPKDIEALYEYRNDPGIVSLLGGFSQGFTKSDMAEWIEKHRKSAEDLVWVITDMTDNCVGHCGFYKINYRTGTADIAICIGSASLWGKGLGGRIVQTLLHHAFQQMNLRKIRAEVLSTNPRSARMFEKCGFVREGVSREEAYKEGRYVDMLVFGLLKNEWNPGVPML